MFDWAAFLDQRGIDYEREGRLNLRIVCPWCSDKDSLRMAVSTEGKGWHCWAAADHRGKSPVRLVAALTGMDLPQAALLAGVRILPAEGFAERISGLLKPAESLTQAALPAGLALPKDFRRFDHTGALAAPFTDYLQRRGFAWSRLICFSDQYKIFYARGGSQRYRVVFTVWDAGRLVAWTGRTIAAAGRSASLRYLTSSQADGAEDISHHLLWQDDLKGRAIALCEGPFDALKIRELGRRMGVTATCFFTAAPSSRQLDRLHEILPKFERKYLVLDRGTLPTMLRAHRDLASHNVQIKLVPDSVKDPGELDVDSFTDLFRLTLC
jgi:hypothetical protein